MASTPMSLGTVALFVGLGLVLLIGSLMQRRQALKAWKAFAELHGLWCDERHLRIKGTWGQLPLWLYTEHQNHEDNHHNHTETVLRVDLRHALPRKLSLQTAGLGAKVLELLGVSDTEVGDEQLDAAFNLANVTTAARKLLLSPDVRDHLLHLRNIYEDVSVEAGMLQVKWRGEDRSVESLEANVGPALDAAEVLEATALHLRQTG